METATTLSPFHSGEREVQTRVGAREFSEHLGQRMIRDYLPGDHKAFFSQLPFVLIGASDAQGRPWASILVGRAGFINAPDDLGTGSFLAELADGDDLKAATAFTIE